VSLVFVRVSELFASYSYMLLLLLLPLPPTAVVIRMSLHTKVQLLELLYRKALRVSSAVKSAMGELLGWQRAGQLAEPVVCEVW
jgi:hypothetical protein